MTTAIVEVPAQLTRVVEQTGLATIKAQTLIDTFAPMFAEADALVNQAGAINVTDATQVTEIKAAKALRLKIKDVRVAADKARKALKEDSLREGNAIQGIYNVIAFLTEPAENRLAEMEKFAERKEAERKAALKAAREEVLRPYAVDTTHYALSEMPEATFAQLLESSRLAHEARVAAARKAEEDRIAAEQARLAEEARVRAENERLRKEKEAAEAAAKAEREKAAAAQRAADESARKERERVEAEARAAAEKARLEREAIEKKARDEAAAAAAKAKAERDAIEAKARAEREAAEVKAAEERKAAAEKAAAAERARKKAEAASADLLAVCQSVIVNGTPNLDGSITIPANVADAIRAAITKATK